MKTRIAVAVLLVLAGTAGAQNIRWNPIGPNAPQQWDITPLSPPRTIYHRIGPLTFGSDGSRGFTTGNTTIVTTPDGSRATSTHLGETVYLKDEQGNAVRCTKYGENVFCN